MPRAREFNNSNDRFINAYTRDNLSNHAIMRNYILLELKLRAGVTKGRKHIAIHLILLNRAWLSRGDQTRADSIETSVSI